MYQGCSPLAGALAVLAGAREPNGVVGHFGEDLRDTLPDTQEMRTPDTSSRLSGLLTDVDVAVVLADDGDDERLLSCIVPRRIRFDSDHGILLGFGYDRSVERYWRPLMTGRNIIIQYCKQISPA